MWEQALQMALQLSGVTSDLCIPPEYCIKKYMPSLVTENSDISLFKHLPFLAVFSSWKDDFHYLNRLLWSVNLN